VSSLLKCVTNVCGATVVLKRSDLSYWRNWITENVDHLRIERKIVICETSIPFKSTRKFQLQKRVGPSIPRKLTSTHQNRFERTSLCFKYIAYKTNINHFKTLMWNWVAFNKHAAKLEERCVGRIERTVFYRFSHVTDRFQLITWIRTLYSNHVARRTHWSKRDEASKEY